MHKVSVRLHYYLVSPITIWLPWQRSLTNRKIRYRSIICYQSAFMWWKCCKHRSSISGDIRQNTPVFVAVWPCRTRRSQNWALSTLELLDQSPWNFTRHRGIICAVKVHIEVAISHSISKCQSNESGEFAIFFTKLVAMATSLKISGKEVQIDHFHPKRFHSVKKLRKSVQRILG